MPEGPILLQIPRGAGARPLSVLCQTGSACMVHDPCSGRRHRTKMEQSLPPGTRRQRRFRRVRKLSGIQSHTGLVAQRCTHPFIAFSDTDMSPHKIGEIYSAQSVETWCDTCVYEMGEAIRWTESIMSQKTVDAMCTLPLSTGVSY